MKADFNGDGLEDLVNGVPGNDTSGQKNSGSATVFYGGDNGIPSADPVAGVPGEDVDTGRNQKWAGIFHVLHGTFEGLSSDPALGREVQSERIGTVEPAASRKFDDFGSALP